MKEYDEVLLKDERREHLIEILEQGIAYLLEYETPHGKNRYEDEAIMKADIKEAIK